MIAAPFAATLALSLCAMAAPPPGQPNFGSHVLIFDTSMSTSDIQASVDAIASQQVDNEFGAERYTLLFKPGTYGSATEPLAFQVGYYTEVAGLGASPNDVVINGHVDVYNRCLADNNCVALHNFWRSLSNLTINVTGLADCRSSANFWAVSKGAPMRRINITGGNLSLMDYCSAGPQYASGGFIADSQTGFVINGSQQQFLTRNSSIGGWSNGVWNQVFSGVTGAPSQSFPTPPYTTLAASPVTREKPYLYADASGNYNVFVPSAQSNSAGTTWAGGPTPGTSIPIKKFFIAMPGDSAAKINNALSSGMNLIFTPGVYPLTHTIQVKRADTVVRGLGFPTLVPQAGVVSMKVTTDQGVLISGIIFDAGTTNSSVLLQVGSGPRSGDQSSDATALHDVFFRIGGATAGSATTSLLVNSNNVILDDVWAWRADHGAGVGWTLNTADTGLVVNGKNVTAYGLFVEHYQKYEAIWNANGGAVILFENEMPPDPPSQAAWMESPSVNGWAALKVAGTATTFSGYGMQSQSVFNSNIFAANGFEVPATLAASSLHDLLTVRETSTGGILNVINDTGGPTTTLATPNNLLSYP
jgi:hypothetical protein